MKKITIHQYRKLKNLPLDFVPQLNFISGANGTCKTSLLHIISNSFQSVPSTADNISNKKGLQFLKTINSNVNPKIETLTKGDKKFNDPAKGIRGPLYDVEYWNHANLSFRRHNAKSENRYAIKPCYGKGTSEHLPMLPVVYLSLTRLYPFGEFQKDSEIINIGHKMPESYQAEIAKLYKDLVHIHISSIQPQYMGDIKNRNDFTTDIDSNTISSGEDNLFTILTAVVSLKYYFESLKHSENTVESICLIDEFDATLHPALQIRLVEILREYSKKYKIQFIMTTHSLSLLEYALQYEDNVIYLVDNISEIYPMEKPDIFKIKMNLKNLSRKDIYADKKIPIFMEDDQARMFFANILNYWNTKDPEFRRISSCFHLVETNLGGDNLLKMFKDQIFLNITKSICILDGDKNTSQNLNYNIISLPGNNPPEKIIFSYADYLLNNDDKFWKNEEILFSGYSKTYYLEKIQPDYTRIAINLTQNKEKGNSNKGKERVQMKKIWEKYFDFVNLVLKYWLNDPQNQSMIINFIKNFHILFIKNALYHGINNKEWNLEIKTND